MASGEVIVRRILGPVRSDIRPLALAIDITGSLIFEQHIAAEDIQVTKLVYPPVAKLLRQRTAAVTKSIERLTRLCWDALAEQDLTAFYIGGPVKQVPTPREMLHYLAVYAKLDLPYYTAIDRYPSLLFQEPAKTPVTSDSPYQFINEAIQKSIPAPVSMVMERQYASGCMVFPVCPACGVAVERDRQNYCDRCGQRLDWGQRETRPLAFPGH